MPTILSKFSGMIPPRLIIILLCAFALRIGLPLLQQRSVASDELEYHLLAKSLVETHSYSRDGHPTAFRPPGYPLFLSLVYFVAGPSPFAARFFQALIDTLTCALIFFLALPYGQRTSLVAAALWAIYSPAVLYANLLLGETVFAFLIVLLSIILIRWRSVSLVKFFFMGIVLGLAILLKPGAALFFVSLFFLLRKLQATPSHHLTFALAVLVIVTPWIVRNVVVLDRAVISSNTGINLFVGNNPETTGGYNSTFPDEIVAAAGNEDSLDRLSFMLATTYITRQPHMVIVNSFKKLAYFLGLEGELLVWSFHPDFTDSSTRFAVKYSSLPPFLILLVNLSYAVVLVSGLLWLFTEPKETLITFFFLFLASLLLLHILFFGGSRFHAPLMPFFTIFAAPAVLDFRATMKNLRPRMKAIFGAITSSLLALWVYELVYVYSVS